MYRKSKLSLVADDMVGSTENSKESKDTCYNIDSRVRGYINNEMRKCNLKNMTLCLLGS